MTNKDMLSLIKSFPSFFIEGFSMDKDSIDLKGIKNIVYAGMGGSAIAGDILKELLYQFSNYPFEVVRNYELPNYVSDKTFLIISSFSGNTEETLKCFKDGLKRKAKILTLSSDGDVEKISKKYHIKHIKLKLDCPPRAALGMTLGALLKKMTFLIKDKSFNDQIEESLLKLPDYNFDDENAKKVAKILKGRMVNVYTDSAFSSVAKRFSNQLHENSKHFSHFNFLPEMDHNEIVGLEKPDFIKTKIFIIFVLFKQMDEKNKKRTLITEKILKDSGFDSMIFEFEDDNRFFNILDSMMTFDLISYYLAIENGVDPMKIERIDILKKRIKG
ncbi:MAG: Hexose-6-phosphate isomerase [candidate division TA06 bacterium 32_111]|uniref:Hexose-6-phosphate isomerase n=2 Tax=Bacteria candidate phyla TaxID=1783234 RepID=A0A101I1J0_UNCT6|nr:MAG: Hexose-6-phosphate isomerase [candidate division TA06 bacterium 32_111]KUK86764.1 MAG: Hexose-6-phosphate isomerase [candidate division TA06 bacterium 34_109]HAF08300.1 bifunctional phosphoglucose/phosphomannose isomerase [candidate division WOR-3 bacterium]HCP16554.1 bifunctional phosphoglucose/phosphomannose isomerase [candidate division WOR-3 bacterium]